MNRVVLLGRLTKDPELRYTQNNTPVCAFTLAVDRKFSKDDEADFIPIVTWQKTAEFCSKYFTKGRKVAVSGRLQTRNWEDNDGKKHWVTEVIADEVDFADSKKDGQSSPNSSSDNKSNNNKQSPPAEKPPWM